MFRQRKGEYQRMTLDNSREDCQEMLDQLDLLELYATHGLPARAPFTTKEN
jgi:hypothetical protein